MSEKPGIMRLCDIPEEQQKLSIGNWCCIFEVDPPVGLVVADEGIITGYKDCDDEKTVNVF